MATRTWIIRDNGKRLTSDRKIRTDANGEYILHCGMKARLKDIEPITGAGVTIVCKQITHYE